MTMTRRRLLDDSYKKTVEGNPAIATDSLARRYPDITMQGWTEQAKTTGAQLFDQSLAEDNKYQNFDINSNDFSVVQNDEFWITGKIPVKPNTTYTINVNAFGAYYSDADTPITTTVKEENPFTTPENANYVCLNVKKSNYQFGSNIMLNEGSTALPWEPYTGGQASPSPDYPQEIVSAGDYNQETGKWEYEITIANAQTDPDKNQTVTLAADRPLTKWDRLTKKNGVWGWEYGSAEIVLDGSEDEAFSIYETPGEGKSFAITLNDSVGGYQTSLCDKYKNINGSWNSDHKDEYAIYSDHMDVTNKTRYLRPPSTEVETVEQWKTWLSGNPLTLWYQTSSETFTPLATTEQEAMNSLYTYRPTTVLTNQQDCQMTLTYKTRKGMGGGVIS